MSGMWTVTRARRVLIPPPTPTAHLQPLPLPPNVAVLFLVFPATILGHVPPPCAGNSLSMPIPVSSDLLPTQY